MDYFQSIIDLSMRLMKYESVYGHGGISADAIYGKTIVQCQKAMLDYCESLGFSVYMDPEGAYSYAQIGQGEDYIAILSHLDVVAAGDLSQWERDPFEPYILDEKLIGRGSADDKVPAALGVLAVKKVIDDDIHLKYPIRLIFGGDEETGFRCIEKYKTIHKPPLYTLVLDGTFPFSFSEKHLLNYEIHTGSTLDVSGGVGYNSVMDHVVWKNGDQIIEVEGKSAHASRPSLGENALVKLANLNEGEDKLFDFVIDLLHPSGEHKLDFLPETIRDETTASIGIVKDGIVYLDVRVPAEYCIESFKKEFMDYLKPFDVKAVETDILEGSITDINQDFAQTILKCYQEKSGDYESKPFKTGSATYGRSFKNNCLSFGPRMTYHITNTHKPNEYVPFDLIRNAFEIYVHTLKTIEEEM